MRLVLLTLLISTASFATEDDPAAQARTIVEREAIQHEWPAEQVREPPAGSWLAALGLTELFFWIFVAAVVAIALLLILFIVREILERRYRGKRRKSATEAEPTMPPWLAGDIADPERLAERGEHGRAIHALLLMALKALIVRSRRPLGDSLTSREVATRLELDSEADGALWALLHAAERVVFGDEPADLDTYLDCKAHYERLSGAGS